MNKKYNSITQPFGFGKYKGVSVQQVYQGTSHLDRDMFIAFILYKIGKEFKGKDGKPIQPEINDFFLKAESKDDVSSYFNTLFTIDTNSGSMFRIKGADMFDKFLGYYNGIFSDNSFITPPKELSHIFSSKKKSEIVLANPKYISWCIKSIPEFYIAPEELEKLEKLPIFYLNGIAFEKKAQDMYFYHPRFTVKYHKFSDEEKELNLASADISRPRREYDNSNYQEYHGEESYSDHFGGYDSNTIDNAFEGDPDAYWNID